MGHVGAPLHPVHHKLAPGVAAGVQLVVVSSAPDEQDVGLLHFHQGAVTLFLRVAELADLQGLRLKFEFTN